MVDAQLLAAAGEAGVEAVNRVSLMIDAAVPIEDRATGAIKRHGHAGETSNHAGCRRFVYHCRRALCAAWVKHVEAARDYSHLRPVDPLMTVRAGHSLSIELLNLWRDASRRQG